MIPQSAHAGKRRYERCKHPPKCCHGFRRLHRLCQEQLYLDFTYEIALARPLEPWQASARVLCQSSSLQIRHPSCFLLICGKTMRTNNLRNVSVLLNVSSDHSMILSVQPGPEGRALFAHPVMRICTPREKRTHCLRLYNTVHLAKLHSSLLKLLNSGTFALHSQS